MCLYKDGDGCFDTCCNDTLESGDGLLTDDKGILDLIIDKTDTKILGLPQKFGIIGRFFE